MGHDKKMTININVMQIAVCKMLVRCTVVDHLNVRWRFDYVGDVPFLHVNKMHDALNEAPLKYTNNVSASRNGGYCVNWYPLIHPIEMTQSMCQLLKIISTNEFLKS